MSINREKLTQIIENDHGLNWWEPDLFVKNIRSLLPEELEIVSPPPEQEKNYNCFVFVFGLQNDPDFLGGNNPIQQEFVKYLINKGTLISVEASVSGCLVFYKNNAGEITHAGVMTSDGAVISKWMWGPIIRHQLFDVPSSFGDNVLFFKPTLTAVIKEVYNIYKASGVAIEPIG